MELRKNQPNRSITENAERNFKNFLRSDVSQKKHWRPRENEPASTSRGIDKAVDSYTPQDIHNELAVIERHHKNRLRRPHELLNDNGEQRVRELIDRLPPTSLQELAKYSKYVEDTFSDNPEQLKNEAKELLESRRHVNVQIDELDWSASVTRAHSYEDPNAGIKASAIEKRKDAEIHIVAAKEAKILIIERMINTQQCRDLEANQRRLSKVMERIPQQFTSDQAVKYLSFLSFSKDITWGTVGKKAEELNRKLQASIDNRNARIEKINKLLNLPSQSLDKQNKPELGPQQNLLQQSSESPDAFGISVVDRQ